MTEATMRTGMDTRGGDRATEVRCTCSTIVATVPAGMRLLTKDQAGQATSTREVTCSGCGQKVTIRLGSEHGRG
jgi:hypothetical protein